MAIGSFSSNSKAPSEIYLSINGGKITQEWKSEPKEEWIPAGMEVLTKEITMGENKGKIKWYVEYDYLDGRISNLEVAETNFGNKIRLTITDGPLTYVLTFPVESSYGKDFIMKMNNLNLSKEIRFTPWTADAESWAKFTGKKTEKGKSGLTLRQDGEKVSNYYTKDDPKGMPQIVEKKIGKQVKWDDTDRLAFFYDQLDRFIEKVSNSSDQSRAKVVDDLLVKAEQTVATDDLPF